MKTLRLHASDDLQLHSEPMPLAGLGETLVRVKAVGIYGSDLHWFTEGVIGTLTVSCLAQEEDHELVVQAIRDYLTREK